MGFEWSECFLSGLGGPPVFRRGVEKASKVEAECGQLMCIRREFRAAAYDDSSTVFAHSIVGRWHEKQT